MLKYVIKTSTATSVSCLRYCIKLRFENYLLTEITHAYMIDESWKLNNYSKHFFLQGKDLGSANAKFIFLPSCKKETLIMCSNGSKISGVALQKLNCLVENLSTIQIRVIPPMMLFQSLLCRYFLMDLYESRIIPFRPKARDIEAIYRKITHFVRFTFTICNIQLPTIRQLPLYTVGGLSSLLNIIGAITLFSHQVRNRSIKTWSKFWEFDTRSSESSHCVITLSTRLQLTNLY